MVWFADDFGAWLFGLLADFAHRKLTDAVLGNDQQRALQETTTAIEATARQWRPGRASEDDPQSADYLARVIDQVFQQAPAPTESLAEYPTLLQGLQAGVAARLAVLEDVHITGTERSSAALLGISVPALTDTLNGHLLRQLLIHGLSGGPLTPLVSQLNHELTRQMLGGQGQDRYAKAAELLDSDKLYVRIGGISALELVARGSASHYPAAAGKACLLSLMKQWTCHRGRPAPCSQ